MGLLGDVGGAVMKPLGGLLGMDDLQAAQRAQGQATRESIASREEAYRKQLAMGAPYRELGYAALPQLQASMQAGSQLDTLRSDMVRNFMGGYLKKQGFDARTSGAVTGQQAKRTRAGEDVSRRGRIRDVMDLGMGQTAQGMGMAGQAASSQAGNAMANAAAQGNVLAQQAYNKQSMLGAGMYGGQRLLSDYITQKEAGRY